MSGVVERGVECEAAGRDGRTWPKAVLGKGWNAKRVGDCP